MSNEMTQSMFLSRRRFLGVSAMAGVCASLPWAHALASVPLHKWNGILLGGNVSLTLAHPDKAQAEKVFETCVGEIKRLENIFTLYDLHSELSRLNKSGRIENPSSEMVDILEKSRHYNRITNGAFDVTVKALEEGKDISLVGMDKLHIGREEIRFKNKGMSITLNGIAQGYITDRITELLKSEGLSNVLVELGEKRSIGHHPSGRPWLLAIPERAEPVPLTDKALATSAARNGDSGAYHVFEPESGKYAHRHSSVSVVASSATTADALSTAFLSMDEKSIRNVLDGNKRVFAYYSG